MIDRDMASILSTYKMLHAAPELSHREEKTSAFFAGELRKLGYTVTDRLGKYENGDWTGYGVIAVMKNGSGPTVLVRSDMDALPVEEQTGAAYTSENKGVMHACGHDIHMTTLLGTAKLLTELKSKWHGTVMLVGQPAEEVVKGADAMLRAGIYEKVAKPDYVIALHDNANMPAGQIGWFPGYFMASADSVNVTMRGMGGHGASPQSTKDPVVMAAEFLIALQTIVSRETSPLDSAVVTVGSIHGGMKRNVIPDEVQLLMTVRTYKPEVRKNVLASIERIAKGIALAAGVPESRAPIVEVLKGESTDATWNDPALSERLAKALTRDMGASNVVKMDPLMVSEDFGRFALDRKIPATMLNVGAVDPARIAAGERLPSLHSSAFLPVAEATLRGAVKAMVVSALELLR
jgi:hippurate hydrolase